MPLKKMVVPKAKLQRSEKMESLQDRYAIYVEQARQLGWPIKTFDEWLNS